MTRGVERVGVDTSGSRGRVFGHSASMFGHSASQGLDDVVEVDDDDDVDGSYAPRETGDIVERHSPRYYHHHHHHRDRDARDRGR